MYCGNCGALVLSDTTLQDNSAQQGGAVCTSNVDSGLQLDVPGLFFVLNDVKIFGNDALHNNTDGGTVPDGLRRNLGGGVYTDAVIFMLKGLVTNDNRAVKGGSIYWRAVNGNLARSLVDSNTRLFAGDSVALLRVAQCPSVLDTSVAKLRGLYDKFNTTYAQNKPGNKAQCFNGSVPEPACMFGEISDPTKKDELMGFPLTSWTFLLDYGCSNTIE